MAVDVDTMDCTALTDSEFEEFVDLSSEHGVDHEIGVFSKLAEEWVLVSQAREGDKLRAVAFYTLERIGGTPSVVIGALNVKRFAKRDTIMRALVAEMLYKALLAFPDEDVLVGTRTPTVGGFALFESLDDVVPRFDYEANGEDRAWGRRLAKRYGIPSSAYQASSFTASGDGSVPIGVDHEPMRPEKLPEGIDTFFEGVDEQRGDVVIAHGWARAEDLIKLGD